MTRSVAVVERELSQAREESIAIGRKVRRLQDELSEARIAEMEANPHPWLGKKVKQERPTHSWRKGAGTKTVRGTLRIYGERQYYRGRACGRDRGISTGDLIVVTKSGATAYRFAVREGEHPWELDE